MRKLLQKISRHPVYIKWVHWEFWPMQIVYFPVYLQHIWLSVKAGNPFFFLNTNPAIQEGLILDNSKYNSLQLIPQDPLPKSILIAKGASAEAVQRAMQEAGIDFPVIVKPDRGFRGLHVGKIEDKKQLQRFVSNLTADYLLQEYIDLPLEIGVFYYRFPRCEKGEIPSVTLKEFLAVTGDGKSTLATLVSKKPRAILQRKRLAEKFKARWHIVIPEGEKVLLEGIGSHNRGTRFINANALIDADLKEVFDNLNKRMEGFYYGRFDIRAASVKDLKAGKNFKILEINGVGAEPTHIYDPGYKLFKAWKELLYLWRVTYTIAMQNQKRGSALPGCSEGKKRWKKFLAAKRSLSV